MGAGDWLGYCFLIQFWLFLSDGSAFGVCRQGLILLICFNALGLRAELSYRELKPVDTKYPVKHNIGLRGGVPEWPKGSDCKSDGSALGGSNPPPSTRLGAMRWASR